MGLGGGGSGGELSRVLLVESRRDRTESEEVTGEREEVARDC